GVVVVAAEHLAAFVQPAVERVDGRLRLRLAVLAALAREDRDVVVLERLLAGPEGAAGALPFPALPVRQRGALEPAAAEAPAEPSAEASETGAAQAEPLV